MTIADDAVSGERAHAQDVGHALGGGDDAAGIEQVEGVAALQHRVFEFVTIADDAVSAPSETSETSDPSEKEA